LKERKNDLGPEQASNIPSQSRPHQQQNPVILCAFERSGLAGAAEIMELLVFCSNNWILSPGKTNPCEACDREILNWL